MENFFEITFGLIGQFTGRQGGIEHGIVQFGFPGVLWLGLLILAYARQKDQHLAHERLLLVGFFLGFCREFFMIVMAALPAYGLYNSNSLHIIFPPIEHAIFDTALIVIAAGYMQYLLQNKLFFRNYLKTGITLTLIVYFLTAFWWGKHILVHQEFKFGETWCDWLFRINASLLLFAAIIIFFKNTKGWKRNAISVALLFFFLNQFLKIPDMILGEVYERYFTPIRNGFYIFGIPIFGYIYIRELYEERKFAEFELQDSHDRLKQQNLVLERTENILRESEKKYRTLFESISDSLFVHLLTEDDLPGRFIEVNEVACKKMGYSKQEFLQLTPNDLRVPDDKTNPSEIKNELLTYDHTIFETMHLTKEGQQISVESHIQLFDYNGQRAVLSIARDITDRKKTETKLRNSEKKSLTWLESSPVCTKIVDLDFNLQYMSAAGVNGLNVDDITQFYGKPYPFDFYPESFNNLMRMNLKKVKETGEIIEQEGSVVDIDGNELWFHSTLVPVNDDDGLIDYIIVVSADITEHKKAEKKNSVLESQLQQSQKMESIGTLAGGIAHDFNNILFPVFGYLEMILEDIPKDDPMRDNLEEIFNGAQRARDLVKQILTFSRQSDHELKPLKTQLVIREALKLLRSSIPSTIKMNENINKGCGLVMADPTHIHQIVMNLCTNAFHAMEESGGKLNVTLDEIQLTIDDLKSPAMAPGPHICLMVSDTGHGMEQHIIDRIFDPYFTTKPTGKGTGLGLAVIHGIVKDYGGHINIYSEPGKGSEFKIYLPVIQTSKTIVKTENDSPLQKGNERVLLVDDENSIVQLEKKMLERLGYQVTVRINSLYALELFRDKPDNFDLVITDMTMPNLTGDKLAGELIKIRPEIPIILCTGFSETMSEAKAAYLGIKGFLLKPIVTKDLSQKIREVLDEN